MSKIDIYVDLSDHVLKAQVLEKLAGDWSLRWNVLSDDFAKKYPETILIAITDRENTAIQLPTKVLRIFSGTPSRDYNCFACVTESSADLICNALKRAKTYLDISEQNQEAIYSQTDGDEALETVAQTLSARIHQLVKQSEMRIALVDQLPTGIVGIDDEGIIVLANPKAIEELSAEDVPLWGMPAGLFLGENIAAFVKQKEETETYIERYGKRLTVRKAAFTLEGKFAGTILVLWNESTPASMKGKLK